MPEHLQVSHPADGVALVVLDRPEKLNAVTMAMQEDLDDLLAGFEADPDVRAVVLAGAGERGFTAGYDVAEMAPWGLEELHASIVRRERWLWRAATTPLPVLAALHGVVYGVGAIMATGADIRIAAPDVRFRFTAGPHGGANATWSLPTLVGRGLASDLLMTSRPVDADEALRIGLVSRVVPREELVDHVVEAAATIATHPPAAMAAIKRLLREHEGRGVEERFLVENMLMRTDLAPRPVGELYGGFLAERAGRG